MAADKFDTGENAMKVSKVGGINLRKKGLVVVNEEEEEEEEEDEDEEEEEDEDEEEDEGGQH